MIAIPPPHFVLLFDFFHFVYQPINNNNNNNININNNGINNDNINNKL